MAVPIISEIEMGKRQLYNFNEFLPFFLSLIMSEKLLREQTPIHYQILVIYY